ncbi:MAG: hypothetical protein PHD76_00255 [Methylacidiphilales bacterium]|nr:hypothetical protein [Candidatus Methylacidiphilales bacterium]
MELSRITFQGPEITDSEILALLPRELAELLSQINGFVQFHGGLHVRGACREPLWHSIRETWQGASAFHLNYPEIKSDDVPFAQDCIGDQFFLRADVVFRLRTETGDVETLDLDLYGFLDAAEKDPIDFLGLHPLMRHQTDGGTLEPGQLLSIYPPYCTKEAANGVSIRAIPATERLSFLADFYRQIGGLPEGTKFRVKVT